MAQFLPAAFGSRAAGWGGERLKSGYTAARRPVRLEVSGSECAARHRWAADWGEERSEIRVQRAAVRRPIDLHDWRSPDPSAQGGAQRRPEEGHGGDGIVWGGLLVARWGGWRQRVRRGGLSREVEGGAW
jgi:hypothetical protein